MTPNPDIDAGTRAVLDGLEKIAGEVLDDRRRISELEDRLTTRGGSGADFSSLGWGAGYTGIREVLPPEVTRSFGAWLAFSAAQPEGSPFKDAEVAAGTAEWFRQSTLLQTKYHARADRARFDKIDEALRGLGSITKAAYQEDTASEGGNLVPTIVESFVLRQIKDAGKLFPRARQITMTRKVHDVPSESTAVTVNWIAEEGALTQGEGNVGKKTLTALKIAGRATMSIELVEDSSPSLLNYLLEVFSEKIAGELDKQVVLGDGSSPAITGIDNTSGINVVASSATAAGRNLTYQLLVNTYMASGEGTAIERGVWITSPKGYGVILGLVDTTGQPIVRFGNVEQAPSGTLFGRPIIVSARFGGTPSGVTATLDDSTNANTKIIYGDPTSILFGTRQGMRWDVTDQVNWAKYQMDARLVGRFASVVGVPANFNRLAKVNYS